MLAPYDKIEERWEADPAVEKRLARERWVATEKIHGAHFVVVAGADGGPLRFGKRRELIPPGESFFGHEVVVARLRDALLRAVDAVRRRWDAHDATVQLHGELFGGRYPHPDVAPEPGVAPVQSGLWYSPRVELCFYDVAIVRGEGRTFAPFDEGMALLADAGLFVAEPIVIGSLAEVRAVAVERVTAIPARLGLPALPAEEGPNLAEGVVLKTVREVALPGGLRARPVVKRKIPRFAEDERYHGAQKPRPPARASGDALARLLEAAASLVTPPRLDSARSKLGPAVGAERLADEVRDDILDELQRRHAADMAALTDADRAILGDQIVGMARALST